MSPTQRTIRELKNQGRRCAIVEKYNHFVKRADGGRGIRQDLFGIIDVLALDPERGVIGIQCCGSDFAAHDRKIREELYQNAIDWMQTPGTGLELWGWRKVKKKRGGKAMVWRPKVKVYRQEDFK
jgi:hypothetical protein